MNKLRDNDWRNSYWTTLQVMAWICFRDRRVVSGFDYQMDERIYQGYTYAPDRPINGAYRDSKGANTLSKIEESLLGALRRNELSAWGKKNGLGDVQDVPQRQWAYLEFNLEGDRDPYAEQPDRDRTGSTRWEDLSFSRDRVLELWPDPLASMTEDDEPRSLRWLAKKLAIELGEGEEDMLRRLVDLAERGAFQFSVPSEIAGRWHPLEFYSMLWVEGRCAVPVADIRRHICDGLFADTEDGVCADPEIHRALCEMERGMQARDDDLIETAKLVLEQHERMRQLCFRSELQTGSAEAELYERRAFAVFSDAELSRYAFMRYLRREGAVEFCRIPTFWGDPWRGEPTDFMAGVEGVRDARLGLPLDEAFKRYSDPGDWAEYERLLCSDGEDGPNTIELRNEIERRIEDHWRTGRLVARGASTDQTFIEIPPDMFDSGKFDYQNLIFTLGDMEIRNLLIFRASDIEGWKPDAKADPTGGRPPATPTASVLTPTDRRLTIAAENECTEWLTNLMRSSSSEKTKSGYFKCAHQKFGVGKRAFDRAWGKAVAKTGADNWTKPGPKSTH